MAGHGEKLTRREEQAIAALLSEPTLPTAAGAAGVGERTLRRWLQQPEFAGAYRDARRAALDAATARLQWAGAEAVETLREVAADKSAKASARVAAARAILEIAFRAQEAVELAERFEQIEAALAALQAAGRDSRNGKALVWP